MAMRKKWLKALMIPLMLSGLMILGGSGDDDDNNAQTQPPQDSGGITLEAIDTLVQDEKLSI